MSSTTMKMSLLALATSVVAVPHYGANPHSKFHMKPSGVSPSGKPYPSGGYNSTIPYPSGSGPYPSGSVAYDDKTTTINTISTSTKTLYSTVVAQPSSSSSPVAGVAAVASSAYPVAGVAAVESDASDSCGPVTITVTASQKLTVTVTGASYTPAPSAAPSSKVIPSKAPVAEYSSKAPVAEAVSSAAGYSVETPKAATSTTPAAVYSAVTPKAAKSSSSSKVVSYVAPTYAQNVAASSTVAYASASASASASSGNSYTGTKRGLAYNEASLCKTLGSNFGFGYNWGQVENNDIGTNFIPMMHKPSDSTAEAWLANVDKAVTKGSNAVMGFNECDHASQCNLEVADACTAWISYMNPIKSSHPSVTIIGPSVTNGGAPMGLDWLTRFKAACSNAIIDATNVHFYDIYEEGQTIERFKAQVEKAAAIYGNKVWVTEFGLNPGSASSDQAVTFLKAAMEYLDGSDVVQGYSWFMVGTGENQLNSGSGLSAIGEAYAST